MLDTDTKRRIDSARDILVGKVPDPKSQVEQITIALIYKFMDDMDAQSEEIGGKRTFFEGEFAKYGWAKLMRSGLGGHEAINLYGEAIARMPENPGIPELFRDIFKNAYLPYRDPETLRSFLKIIDEFVYDHSERLGDAFEYLLSVLGSQGNAGQFRTPRHIIDFMVQVVDPKKGETVLDPACGTAGFLVSAYKHVLAANRDAEGNSTLTPAEHAKLTQGIRGYDISPDMVRLSLVNLYLHGFPDPHIYEYDTLTSQERWNDYAEVILANPPFMSPTGGIKPHNRFSVQSKRSEVLFVDYMAEHLAPGGRAAIIVPEGVIFQSQNAYVQLRRMLVDEYLVAVVSLPAGVFNPYSGVKTSILFLDKALAKRASTIAFFAVENDGFGLGAQRREITKNDLPEAQTEIAEYLRILRDGESLAGFAPACGHVVPKDLVSASVDCALVGDRYRPVVGAASSWPLVSVGSVFRKSDRSVLPESLEGPVTYVGLENMRPGVGQLRGLVVTDTPAEIRSLKNRFKGGDILYGRLRPNLNKVWLADREGVCSTDIFVIEATRSTVDPALYAHVFRGSRFNAAVLAQLQGAQLPRIGWTQFAALLIPLPPLEAQLEIVGEIEAYQTVIDGSRAVVKNYRPTIPFDLAWPRVPVGEVSALTRGVIYEKSDEVAEGGHQVLRANNIDRHRAALDLSDVKHISDRVAFPDDKRLGEGDIFICLASGSSDHIGKVAFVAEDTPYYFGGFMGAIRCDRERVNPAFLYLQLRTPGFNDYLRGAISGASINNLSGGILGRYEVPLPSLDVQREIVDEIAAEQLLVDGNADLAARLEAKKAACLARLWGTDDLEEAVE